MKTSYLFMYHITSIPLLLADLLKPRGEVKHPDLDDISQSLLIAAVRGNAEINTCGSLEKFRCARAAAAIQQATAMLRCGSLSGHLDFFGLRWVSKVSSIGD